MPFLQSYAYKESMKIYLLIVVNKMYDIKRRHLRNHLQIKLLICKANSCVFFKGQSPSSLLFLYASDVRLGNNSSYCMPTFGWNWTMRNCSYVLILQMRFLKIKQQCHIKSYI